MKRYWVYILTNPTRTLYIGVTSNLQRRIHEHQHKVRGGFTSRYHITQLVYFEETNDVHAALTREKQLKGWKRARKIALIEAFNPEWKDLSRDEGFFLPMAS